MTTSAAVRMHVERTADPDTLRWVVHDGLVSGYASITSAAGYPGALPPRVTELLASGQIVGVGIEPGAISVTSSPAHWSTLAPQVNTAWREFFRSGGVIRADTSAGESDRQLAAAVRGVLDGDIGELARSHGGAIALLNVEDGTVYLRLTGACRGCPSAGRTLKQGIEARLRARFPQVRAVEAELAAEPGGPMPRQYRGLPLLTLSKGPVSEQ